MWVSLSLLKANRKYVLLTVLLLAALYVLVPQLGDFRSSEHLLRHPNATWVAIAIFFTAATYLAAALTYTLLAFSPLPYARTVIVELAANFINRLLPAGIGALGSNYAYLRRMRHTVSQAATVAGVNNLLGVAGHLVLLAISLMIVPGYSLSTLGDGHSVHLLVVELAVVALVALSVAAIVFGKRHFTKALRAIRHNISRYWRRPHALVLALSSSMTLTLCNILCLWCSAAAIGIHIPFVVALLIFSLGIGAGTVTPTPGGLGGFEAGLTAGFIAYHAAAPSALAATLLYRLISYWLPLLAGLPALVACHERGWLTIETD